MTQQLGEAERRSIESNLFPAARPILDAVPDFPWHRDQSGAVTAGAVNSSQALAIDVLWTIQSMASRDRVLDAWCERLELPYRGPWEIRLEYPVDNALLGEPRCSQIDAVATSTTGALIIECKFTERDGGSCSQVRPIGGKSANAGKVQCNGSYTLQTNPVNGVHSRCALSGKRVRYWDFVSSVLNLDPAADHKPCPFRGGWYQWMRNLVVAHVLGRQLQVPAAFIVLYAQGPFAIAKTISGTDDWEEFLTATRDRSVPVRTDAFQTLLDTAWETALPEDLAILEDLRAWTTEKIQRASRLRQSLKAEFSATD